MFINAHSLPKWINANLQRDTGATASVVRDGAVASFRNCSRVALCQASLLQFHLQGSRQCCALMGYAIETGRWQSGPPGAPPAASDQLHTFIVIVARLTGRALGRTGVPKGG